MLMAWSNYLNNRKSFASKPAPTVECISNCGSGLAREDVSEVTTYNGKYRLNNARNAAGFTGLAR